MRFEQGETLKERFLSLEKCLGIVGVEGFDHQVSSFFQVFGEQSKNLSDQIETVFLIDRFDACCIGGHIRKNNVEFVVPEGFKMEKIHLHQGDIF